ncbi:MAG: DUF370 domain-containing protein [Firmicutes bacterium]|jgi:hypothetical protein|nr:DUF370 domain-containing protein [Bacillota bacterium]NLL87381.1 DUF370 domain-containing protein [Bacillota bacterium]HKM17654.1 extracellular matrix/biofilm biosynthesis regulator RemA family protein [Limnochordia bacterium]
MFLHIGREVTILAKEIVAIIDLNAESNSEILGEFVRTAAEEGFVDRLTDSPCSVIVTTYKIYLSPISSRTLGKRLSDFGD